MQGENQCRELLFTIGATRLGEYETFRWTAILFQIVGISFGTSYSLMSVDCFDWVKTVWWKRLIRGILGLGISYGMFEVFDLIGNLQNERTFNYIFDMVVPFTVVPLFIYGPFQILCKKIGLVDVNVS